VNPFRLRRWSGPASVKIVNVLMFNISWFAILLTQSSLLAPIIVLLNLSAHFYLMGKGKPELLVVAGVTAFGLVVDQLLFATGVFNLEGKATYAPLWLTCLWPVFATTLMHAFDWLQTRVILSIIFGAVGGTLSYIAGIRLTSIEFGSLFWGPIIIGTLWAVSFPLFLKISAKIARSRHGDVLGAKRPTEQRSPV
jgi:hypothetical protein